MERKLAKACFAQQKTDAKARGIEWHLTFDEWLAWWGDDLDRRGPHRHQLQMQRPMDAGPYALWNIVKGHPKDNAMTGSAMHRNMHIPVGARPRRDDEPHEDDGPPSGYVTSYSAYGIG